MSVQLSSSKLSKEKGVALYVQLSRALREMIREQGAKPGDPLPTEEQLRAAYGVSRSTIRDALAQLEQEHLVERRQGIGTFVSRPLLKRDLQALTGFSEDMISRGLRPSSRLLDYQQPAVGNIPPDFGEEPLIHLVRVVRLRLADGEPFGIHDTLIPQEVVERCGFTKERLEQDQSLSFYASLENAGYTIQEGREHLTACAADQRQARLMGVRAGAPLIKVVRLSWSPSNELLEHITALYLPERYEYVIDLRR
ncbi:MAG: GntR family transcriptional regulator [Chloroflexota bacterium]